MFHDICTLWKRLEMKEQNSSSTTRKDSIESLLVAFFCACHCLLLHVALHGTLRLGTTMTVICSDWLASVTRDLSLYFSIREHLQITRKFKMHVSEKFISLFFSNLSTVWCHSSLNCWVQHLEERFIKETSGHFSVVSQAGKLNSLSVGAKRVSEKNFTYREQHTLTFTETGQRTLFVRALTIACLFDFSGSSSKTFLEKIKGIS